MMNESGGKSDELVFEDNELTRHNELEQQARESGYFVFEKSSETVEDGKKPKNKIHFLGLKTDDMMGGDEELMITIESDVQDQEELDEILKQVRMTPLFRKILHHVAECQKTNIIPFLQSEPGTGKTFTYEIWNKLLHGNGKTERPEYLICTPKTSELDIIGHWAPKGDSGEETKDKVKEILDKNESWQDFKVQFEKQLEGLARQKSDGSLTDESFNEEVGKLTNELIELQREIVSKTGNTSNWVFHKGALLRSYKDPVNSEDKGRMLIVDELDKLPPNLQNIFLQVSGSRAQLAKTIVTYADGGTTDYERGENTSVVFAGNYKAEGNVMIAAPMMDRVTPLRISRAESDADAKEQITKYSFNELQEVFPDSNEQTVENLREFLSGTLAQLHLAWKEFYRTNKSSWLADGKSDEQPKEYSQRTTISFEDALLHKLQEELDGKANYRVTETVDAGGKSKAVKKVKTDKIDLEKIFTSVFQTHYLNFCPNRELVRTKFVNVTMKDIFTAGTEKLEKSADGKKFEVKSVPVETAKTQYLYAYEKDKKVFRPAVTGFGGDKPADLQDLGGALNTLTEMITHVDKLKAKEEAERLKMLEEKRDALKKMQEGFLNNPSIPASVKEKLTERL